MSVAARIALIAAVARNGVIGVHGALPWRIAADLRKFRALTMGKPVIMGRKTFETLKKPLDGRTSIVVTRNRAFDRDSVETAFSMEEAMRLAEDDLIRRGGIEIMIAGGGEIYAETIGRADRLYVSHVDAAPTGDARFPPIDERLWSKTGEEGLPASEGDTARAAFAVYERRQIDD